MPSTRGGFEACSREGIAAGHGARTQGSPHHRGMCPKSLVKEKEGETACRKDLTGRKSDFFLPVSNLIQRF